MNTEMKRKEPVWYWWEIAMVAVACLVLFVIVWRSGVSAERRKADAYNSEAIADMLKDRTNLLWGTIRTNLPKEPTQ